jgi:hypothetical protein
MDAIGLVAFRVALWYHARARGRAMNKVSRYE